MADGVFLNPTNATSPAAPVSGTTGTFSGNVAIGGSVTGMYNVVTIGANTTLTLAQSGSLIVCGSGAATLTTPTTAQAGAYFLVNVAGGASGAWTLAPGSGNLFYTATAGALTSGNRTMAKFTNLVVFCDGANWVVSLYGPGLT